ncbi:hypothetical protein GH714_023810 [Hevea brasiliensis]|uniref:Leucine-rich repeat-containing N-terminal plant-type domain-containing protein n=1 Tax=Hevea brasiliensis TaxID=3981 RepID=A0A6A6LLK3_HEVBR|nr:hypothetical protein GH714_023810 [Hevea brasiliensis]
MELALVKCFMLCLVIILLRGKGHNGCNKVERMALLEFKSSLYKPQRHGRIPNFLLPSWIDDPQSDCCSWERVTCNHTTSHVIELSLDNAYHDLPFFSSSLVNMSMFQPLKELRILNLSYNGFDAGSESLARLEKLEILDLSHNSLDESIMPSLGGLTSLKKLILSQFGIYPKQGFPNLSNLSGLEYLDIRGNYIQKVSFRLLGRLSSLKYLDLSSNSLEGPLPLHEISNLSKLELLILEDNSLNGTLRVQDLKSFANLQILDLGINELDGSILPGKIPRWIGNLTWLQILDMRNNSFEGELTCEPFSVAYLDLSHNFLSGSLPSCSNTGNLEQIHLQENNFTGSLPEALLNSSNLLALNVRDNRLSGKIPNMIAELSNLRVLLLGGNNLSGSIPKNCARKKALNIAPFYELKLSLSRKIDEASTGPVPRTFAKLTQIESLDLSHNSLSGEIPSELTDLLFISLLGGLQQLIGKDSRYESSIQYLRQ